MKHRSRASEHELIVRIGDSHCSGIVLGFCGLHSKTVPVDFEFLVHNVTVCKLPVGQENDHW